MKNLKNQIILLVVTASLVLAGKFSNVSGAVPAPDQVLESKTNSFGRRATRDQLTRPRLDLRFDSAANATEFTVRLTHRGVFQPWFVEANGQRIGKLPPSYMGPDQVYFSIPAGVLTNGANTVSVVGEDFGREISIANIVLFHKPLRDLLKLRTVTVTVTDEESGKPIPARITILQGDEPAELFNVSSTNAAVRTGLIYTDGKETSLEIPAGRYRFFATRGMEWSLGRKTVSLSAEQPGRVDLRIRRQVDTRGFIAADTHIHTVTFSGHGDATVNERMLTIAGEGVELAIATDHNHHTDYARYQSRLELNSYFTPVTGNEVTTKNGHFNAFPMPLKGPTPDHQESDWVKLMADIRFKGAQVVIWNHPHYPDLTNSPLTKFHFNYASGDRFNGPAFNFDAMEIVNSSSPTTVARKEVEGSRRKLFSEWFAILNRGERITGVGSSDSHTVVQAVGQGRTYIRSSTDDAARINVDEMVRNFLAGDTSISYGIFADVKVNARHHMGETLKPENGKVEVNLHIASADWVKPRRVMVFLNGLPVAEKSLQPASGKPFDEQVTLSIPVPKHDAHLVCAVFGDGVTVPFWKTLGKYTAAVTNPIFLDGDGDGKYQSPRTTAENLLATTDGSVKSVWSLIEKSDDAVAGQMLGLLYLNRNPGFVRELDARVNGSAAKRPLYKAFLANSPLIIVKSPSANAKASAGSH